MKLFPGDLVEVKSPEEILRTLSAEGDLDGLPFMPEMLEHCGKKFRVSKRAVTTCISGPDTPREFKSDDIVTLENVRCSGASHDGCQKGCLIFWPEAWLRKANDTDAAAVDAGAIERLRSRLKTKKSPKIYWCQASELPKITHPLSRWRRVALYFLGLRAGNFGALQMIRSTGIWAFWRLRRICFGVYARGHSNPTPTESLRLQPGEWIEIKSIENILKTLNEKGQNNGLYFSPDMRLWCRGRHRVRDRIDKIILDGTGEMRQLRNTVTLEGATCGCAHMGFGANGCSRCELLYWRETWLRRADKSA